MKKDLHPEYHQAKVTCISCGNEFTVGSTEDEIKVGEAEVQKLTDTYIAKVDQLAELKEKDIMTL